MCFMQQALSLFRSNTWPNFYSYSDLITHTHTHTHTYTPTHTQTPTRHCKKKMKFSIKDFFSKCDQIHRKKSLIDNFIFCGVHTQRHTVHTGGNKLTHPYKYTLTPPVICSHSMNNSPISKTYFTEFHNVFFLKKLLTCRSHISID